MGLEMRNKRHFGLRSKTQQIELCKKKCSHIVIAAEATPHNRRQETFNYGQEQGNF